ncbi:MAG: hypothetical protein JWP33_202, partial [Blastococcus sp.]|nr:hypothetical protein [Blastococcus sp.]
MRRRSGGPGPWLARLEHVLEDLHLRSGLP